MAISALIDGVRSHFLDEYATDVSQSFLDSLTQDAIRGRIASSSFFHLVAESEGQLCGVISIRDGSHLYHLFVATPFHRLGIGKALWDRAQHASGGSAYTVNSSVFAIPFYERLGFVATASLQGNDGVRYQPMRWVAKQIPTDFATTPGG